MVAVQVLMLELLKAVMLSMNCRRFFLCSDHGGRGPELLLLLLLNLLLLLDLLHGDAMEHSVAVVGHQRTVGLCRRAINARQQLLLPNHSVQHAHPVQGDQRGVAGGLQGRGRGGGA